MWDQYTAEEMNKLNKIVLQNGFRMRSIQEALKSKSTAEEDKEEPVSNLLQKTRCYH